MNRYFNICNRMNLTVNFLPGLRDMRDIPKTAWKETSVIFVIFKVVIVFILVIISIIIVTVAVIFITIIIPLVLY